MTGNITNQHDMVDVLEEDEPIQEEESNQEVSQTMLVASHRDEEPAANELRSTDQRKTLTSH